nr:hypothetical protein [Tanacetum cinerariifolium]
MIYDLTYTKDQAWMESSRDSDQEINANMVFMAQIEKVLSNSEASSSSADKKIYEVSYYLLESESESEFETLEYYDNSTHYGLFVNNDDDQEIFHDAIDSASENFIKNHIDSQKVYVDRMYNGRKGIGFENPSYFCKAKELRPSLYDDRVIGLGYTLMDLTHWNEALKIEKFKRGRDNKIEFAYDYENLNASYVNKKINFSDDYFQEIINLNFEKINSTFQQTSSLKPNKMHKAFPLPVMVFPLPEEVPTTSEESSHCQKKKDATAEKIALLLKSSSNCQSKSYDSYANLQIKESKAYKTYLGYAIGTIPPKVAKKFKKASPSKKDSVLVQVDEEPVQKGKRVKRSTKKSLTTPATGIVIREPPVETQSKRKEKVDVARGKGIDLFFKVDLTEEALMKEIRKKSLRDFHRNYDKPGVPDVTKDDSTKSESESWGNDDDDRNDEEGSEQENNSEEHESDSEQDTDGSESDSKFDQQDDNDDDEVKDDDTTSGEKSGRTVTLTAEDIQRKKNDVKVRTTLLLSLLDEHQLRFKIEQDDLNQKFFISLAPEWLMHTIVWKNRSDLNTMSLDDLYNHLKGYESEVQKKSEPNSQNMAFISSAKHISKNEDGNTVCVPTASTNVPTASASVATICQDTACAYIAFQSSGSQIKFEDINQIDKDDMEEIDIK